jgi:hypothetical protein
MKHAPLHRMIGIGERQQLAQLQLDGFGLSDSASSSIVESEPVPDSQPRISVKKRTRPERIAVL